MNFRKLISAALLISLITVITPNPFDNKMHAFGQAMGRNMAGGFCGLLALASLGITAYGAPNLRKCYKAIKSPNNCVNHNNCSNQPCLQDTATYNSYGFATLYSIVTGIGLIGLIGGCYGISKNS